MGGLKVPVDNILTLEFLQSVLDKEVKEIAEISGCGRSTVRKYLHKYGLPIPESRKGKNAGENNTSWKGGRYKKPNGYVMVRVGFGKYEREHILIIEQHIGRKLFRDEIVHHLNGVADDNRLDNLLVMVNRDHDKYHTTLRNLGWGYSEHTIMDILLIVYPEYDLIKLEMYAELTRIISVRAEG